MSKRIPSEKTTASCGHTVTVKMTPDPDLNIELMEEATYLWCPRCQAAVANASDRLPRTA